ncbi:protocadherin gamma-A12-like [Babylonia areolata]|uniref:protocadherin gamma-A12-like n=1 Tax=Babylonia areolata TaxID=304850 RepID=UPI003FD37BCC
MMEIMSYCRMKPFLPVCLILISFCRVSFSVSAPEIQVKDRLVSNLYQHQSSLKQLFEVSCVTDPPGQLCDISILDKEPSTPCGRCFTVLPNCAGTSTDYCLVYVPLQGFLHPALAPRYELTLQAEDEAGLTSQKLLDVRVTTNSPPYFDSATLSITVEIADSKEKRAGEVLATVTAKDDEDAALTYTMATEPNVDDIVINSFSGEISSRRDVKSLCINAVTCLVSVQDPYNTAVGPYVVNLVFKGPNNPPIITNLDTDLYFREGAAKDDTVLELSTFDDTIYPDLLYTFSTSPATMKDFFYFRDNTLKLKEELDYETHPHLIKMQIQASDGYCKSKDYTLAIRLVDINEPPTLLPEKQTVETCEGLVDIMPVWNASDPDEDDQWSFTDVQPVDVQPNQYGRFKIHEKTGKVSTLIDYDLDVAKHPSTVQLIVTLSDQHHETATATLTVLFVDCNDNAPAFPRSNKVMKVTPCDPVGTSLGSIPKASDADSDFRDNNVITYAGTGGLASVNLDGNVVVDKVFEQGQQLRFPVYATDEGQLPGPLKSKNPLWVNVYAEACPVTKPKTTVAPDTTPSPPTTISPNAAEAWNENKVWVAVAGLVVGVLFMLAVLMFVRYGWSRCLQSCQGSSIVDSSKGTATRGGRHGMGSWPTWREYGRGYPVRKPIL